MASKRRRTAPPTIHSAPPAVGGNEPISLSSFRGTQEGDVGIDQFVTQHEGFSAILKHRYSDFIVHELDLDGRQVELTSLEFDLKAVDGRPADSKEEGVKHAAVDGYAVLAQTHDAATVEAIRTYVEAGKMAGTEPLVLPPEGDKAKRTALHDTIRLHFPELSSDVVKDEEDRTCVRIGHKGHKIKDRRRALPAQFCGFVLYKELKDTMAALSIVAAKLGVPLKNFSFAGTKDRRAITTQRVQVKGVAAERLFALNKADLWGIRVNHFAYADTPLCLGDLRGNHFTVVLRNVENAVEEDLDRIMTSIKADGFVNYYGMQRFGTTSIPTHHIGVAILQSNYAKAVDLILAVRDGESKDITAARTYLKDNPSDYKGTLNKIPKRCIVERQLLVALARHADPRHALESLPRNSRLMYLHAYQSYVWNKMASVRLAMHELRPVVGDLVVVGDDVLLDESGGPMGGDSGPVSGNGGDQRASTVSEAARRAARFQDDGKGVPIHVLSEADVAANRYSIYDVVLPLPGHAVQYPANEMGDAYKAQLVSDGLSLDSMRHEVKDYSLSGAYRKLLVRPDQLTWRTMRYSRNEDVLTYSDLDKAKGKPPPTVCKEGPFLALVMTFSLPPASYATMLIREAIRTETASEFQRMKTEDLKHKTREHTPNNAAED